MNFRSLFFAATALTVLAFSCAKPAPKPEVAPPPPAPAAPAPQAVIGTVRVTATALNVRRDPATSAEAITLVKKGARLALLERGESWMKVRLDDGTEGWVTRQYVQVEGEKKGKTKKAQKSATCLADADFAFLTMPTPTFSDSSAHGEVVVDATVDASGSVTGTKVVSNSTGDEALAFLTEREIKSAKFVPPIRDCVKKAFIFTYKRSY